MFKKLVLMAVAVGALVAFAVPASASATEWTANGKAFTGHTDVEIEGHAEFYVTSGGLKVAGVTCEAANFTLTLEGESDSGTVTGFEVTEPTTRCHAFGALTGCEPAQPDKEGTWSVTATANGNIDITGIQFKATYHNCSASQIAGGSITLTPVSSDPLENLSGSGTALGGVDLVASGLEVLAPHAGVIGIS